MKKDPNFLAQILSIGSFGDVAIQHQQNGKNRFPVTVAPTQKDIEESLHPDVLPDILELIKKQRMIFTPAEFVILFWRGAIPFGRISDEVTRVGLRKPSILQIISFWANFPKDMGSIIFMHDPILWEYPALLTNSSRNKKRPHCLGCHYAQSPGDSGTKYRHLSPMPVLEDCLYHPIPSFAAITGN